MPDKRRRRCMSCGRPDSEVGAISWRGNCRKCGRANAEQAMTALAEKRGPVFNLWATKIIAGVTATLSETNSTRS